MPSSPFALPAVQVSEEEMDAKMKQIYLLLEAALSPHDAIRGTAETQLDVIPWFDDPTLLAFLKLASNDTVGDHIKQISLLSLKKAIKEKYLDKDQAFSAQSRNILLYYILPGIAVTIRNLRLAWCGIYTQLIIHTASVGDSDPMAIAMNLIRQSPATSPELASAMDICKILIDDGAIPWNYIIDASDQIIRACARYANNYDYPIPGGNAVSVLRSMLEYIHMISQEQTFVQETLMQLSGTEMFEKIINAAIRTAPPDATSLKFEMLMMASTINDLLPISFKRHSKNFLETLLNELKPISAIYFKNHIISENTQLERYTLLDGTDIGLKNYINLLLDCITDDSFAEIMDQFAYESGVGLVDQVTEDLIKLAHITQVRAAEWEVDIDLYLEAEIHPESQEDCSIRSKCQSFVEVVLSQTKSSWDAVFRGKFTNILAAKDQTWLNKEAVIFLMHSFSKTNKRLQDFVVNSNAELFVSSPNVFVNARSILLLADSVSEQTSITPHELLLDQLRNLSNNNSEIITVSRFRTFPILFEKLPKDTLSSIQGSLNEIFVGAAKSSDTLSPEKCLILLNGLEKMLENSQQFYKITAVPDSIIVASSMTYSDALEILLVISQQHTNDFEISSLVEGLYEDFAANAPDFEILFRRTLSTITSIFDRKEPSNTELIQFYGCELLNSLAKGCNDALPKTFVHNVLDRLLTFALDANDNDTLITIQELLVNVVNKGSIHISSFSSQSLDGIQFILQVIAKIITTSSEEGGFYIGELVFSFLRGFGNSLDNILPDIFNAVTHRLQIASNPRYIQTLLSIYAKMIVSGNLTYLIELLAKFQNQNGSTGLEAVIQIWCDNFGDIQGYNSIVLHVMALISVVKSNDPRVLNCKIKEERTNEQKGVIMTRSRRSKVEKTIVERSFVEKLVKLFIAEYEARASDSITNNSGKVLNGNGKHDHGDDDDDDDDDESWEDEEEVVDVEMSKGVGKVNSKLHESVIRDITLESDLEGRSLKGMLTEFLAEAAEYKQICDALDEEERELLRSVVNR